MEDLIKKISNRRKFLEDQLKIALSTMEKKETVFSIRKEIKENQRECPHNFENGQCTYCGKKVER